MLNTGLVTNKMLLFSVTAAKYFGLSLVADNLVLREQAFVAPAFHYLFSHN